MLEWLNEYIFGVSVPVILICAGVFYGMRLGWFHLRHTVRIFRVLTERGSGSGTSSARALSLALAGTLGVGNIVGVSAAIASGGFGAIFWMWVSAFFAMILKYAEIVLALRYRRYDACGRPHGAAMYYIKAFIDRCGYKTLGSVAAGIFALLCIANSVTMGSVIQINAIVSAGDGVLGIPPMLCGAALALITFFIIGKGSERIVSITSGLVPLMTLGYLVLSVAVLALRAERIPYAFGMIFSQAFEADSAIGGIGGFLLSDKLRYGAMRGLVSNEAGCGTSPAAHAVSNEKSPAKQGVWGIFEVFADTILLCTVTALVVIVSYDAADAASGDHMMMTLNAYSAVLGDAAAYFMTAAVLCFGFATIVCWAHYGMESVAYLSERLAAKKIFILVYCASVFVGACSSSEIIWQVADLAIGAMTLINVIVICMMSKEVREETQLWLGDA